MFELNPHIALHILRSCLYTPKMTHIMRCSPIWQFQALTTVLDHSLNIIVSKILNCSFDDRSWTQAVLPVRHGGLGNRSIGSVALPAFLSSCFGSLPLVSKILNSNCQIADNEVALLSEARLAWDAI